MSIKMDVDIKIEPGSEEDHDIDLESGSSEHQDIQLESKSNEDQDLKLEPDSNVDDDVELEPKSNEDQDIKLESENNEDQDITVEPDSTEDQDIKLEPETNEDHNLKLDSQSNEENEIENLHMLNETLNEPSPSTSASGVSNSEQYSKYETALKYNRMYDNSLQQYEHILCLRLKECQQKLKEVKEEKQTMTFDYTICGTPYFRDKSNIPAPDNEDTIMIRQLHMYDFSIVSPATAWTYKEKSMFLDVLLQMSRDNKKIELNSKIAAVRRESTDENLSPTSEEKIATLKKEIVMVDQMELKDIALSLDEEYDWDLVANELSFRHKPLEYKAFWKLYLHPTINKAPWSTSERKLLLKIASEENLQNWKKIASLLGTGRTSFQCFVQFRTNVSHPFTSKKWTKEEEEYLRRIVEYYKVGDYIPWGKVTAAMDNRTRIQIYNKYLRLLEFRKGRFLKEEDEVILTCNDKFGANFKKMANFLPGRSPAQCRNRFQILKKKCVSTVWSIAEDQKLIKFLSTQISSVDYSGIAQHFPDKDRQHIRSRCITLRKWMKVNPNEDIACAPRRASRNLGHGVLSHDLNRAIKRLKARLESEENDKRIKSINMNCVLQSESDIDNTIRELLSQEKLDKIGEAECCALISLHGSDEVQEPAQYNKHDIENLRKCLTLLRAKLDKNMFMKSPLSEKYKRLLEPDQNLVPVIKVKSYSRKKPETTLKVDSVPDIWGTKCLPPPTYVLPPNYCTVTILTNIMSSTSKQLETKEEKPVINPRFKRKPVIKKEMDLLMERFKTIFLWPMLLANQPPREIEPPIYVKKKMPIKHPHFDKGDWNAVAIPKPKATDKIQHNAIDLNESPSTSNINIDLQSVIETSNFDSIKF